MNGVSRRDFVRLGGVAGTLALGRYAWAAEDKTVTFIGWGGTLQDAQRKILFRPFEKETGIKVVETTIPSLPKIKTMVESKNVEVDLVDGQAFLMLALGKLGYFEPIDYATIGTERVGNLLKEAIQKHGVGSYTFSECLGYRTDVFARGSHPTTWADFWDVKRFPGRRAMNGGTKGIRPNLEFALLADGVPIDKLYPIDENRAWKSLSRIKPQVVKWWTESGLPAQLLVSKEVVLTTVFNGRIDAIKKEGQPIDVEFNQAEHRMQYWLIPKGAAHRENAMRLIAFAMQPERQAEFAKEIAYGPTNRAAFKYISPERAAELPSSPENVKKQFFINDEWWAENLPRVTQRWESWILE